MYQLDASATQTVMTLPARLLRSYLLMMVGFSGRGGDPRRSYHVPMVAQDGPATRPARAHAWRLWFLLGLALNQLVLLLAHRVRPYGAGKTHLLITKSADRSFPSDHATASMAIAAAFLLQGMRRTKLAFLIAALLLMASRVYLGTLYASDVIGSAATGFIAALVVLAFYREGRG